MRHAIIGVLFGAGLVGGLPLLTVAPRLTAEQPKEEGDPRWDEDVDTTKDVKSKDLRRDLNAMWRTVSVKGEDWEVSPVSAINAASRVFNTVGLKGKTKDEIHEVLKVKPREKYGFHRPFWPAGVSNIVYRFDCGNFGWQFNIGFDKNGKVVAVDRKWIE